MESGESHELIDPHEPRLRRSLGLFDATAIGLGAIIGAGIFVAIGPAVEVAGSAAIIGLAVAGIVALFNSLSSAQLAAAYPVSGGTYAYGRRVINDLTGFMAGWIFIIAAIAADSAIALTFAAYLDHILPPIISPRLMAVILAVVLTGLNYYGVRYSAAANRILVVLKVGILAFFVILGAFFFEWGLVTPLMAEGPANILHSAAILFFAYTGYARVATLGEEVRDPERTIPRAILLALGGSAGLYLAVLVIALGLLGAGPLGASETPLANAMLITGITAAALIISFGALVATSSVLLTDLLGVSRTIFAMARNSDLPRFLSAVHPKHGTPHLAVIANGAAVVLLAAFLPLRSLVEAGSFGLLVYYGITNLAAFLLSDEERRYHRGWAAAGFLSCFALAFFLTWQVIALQTLVIAAGVAYFLVRRAISGRGRR